ncbi:hypothetical protein COT27_02415 [Candidatus Kuenenbacteria bacterium CG08_land_8_20_14_0_20_37_23]|uniref:Uncharacterized protein n=1 Tax=Candidatus Kuenenbacteria bacterium CG08_land_8_20_14_0_20_37_23 TaxID=1974617 RepID=A0A2M6XSG6_9BACT|nr:MAG: hypothetical protein COT27_02415 [Candidatus Kuenenbacteria bacterium CG08_land_8_20_14_0_20_37_23]
MPTNEEQIKKFISQSGGKATKQQIVRESKLSSGYIDFLCQSLCRKGEIIFSDGFYTLKTSIPAKISGNEPHPSLTNGGSEAGALLPPKPEVILKPKKDKVKTAKVLKRKKIFSQTQKLKPPKPRKQKKSTKNLILKNRKSEVKKRPGYITIQFQAKFPFLKLVFIPFEK